MNQYEMKKLAYQSNLRNRALQVLLYLIDRANKEQTWKRINIRKTECKETRNRYARRSYLVGFSGEWMGNEEGKRDEKEPLDKDWCRHGNPAV